MTDSRRLRLASPLLLLLATSCTTDSGDNALIPGTGSEGDASSSTGADTETGGESSDSASDGDTTSGDGDSDTTAGDGDTTAGDGDATTGDGDATTGDGDATTGDGDATTADGDGDATTGDGDATTGDGDGDATTGDGDATTGDGDGDATTGDGDGDATTGDGDGDGDPCAAISECAQVGDQQCFGEVVQTCGEDQMGCLIWEDSQDCAELGNFICVGDSVADTASCQEETPCFTEQPVVDFKPATIMFVLDYSGSMCQKIGTNGGANCNPNGDTRWKSLRSVVDSVAGQYEGTIKFGATLFPHALPVTDPDFGACEVNADPEVLPVLNNLAGLNAGLPANNVIDEYGFTPAESGYRAASDWMNSGNNLPPLSEENRAIIFILDGAISDGRPICVTQGQTTVCGDDGSGAYYDQFYSRECSPSCTNLPSQNACNLHWQEAPTGNDVDTLTAEIASNEQAGVPTFVVGIDIDSEFTSEMNSYATAGGYPLGGSVQYYETSSQAALNAALAGIVDVLSSCTIDLSIAPLDPATTQVEVNGTTYYQITEAECMAGDPGWYYSEPDNTQIELCGATCDGFQSTGQADVEFFCEGS